MVGGGILSCGERAAGRGHGEPDVSGTLYAGICILQSAVY